ncbi:sulfatase-like hydrolase/transferase [Hasllibacter sp. MH4015]|uniref:sulfatase-like hydrolase/transferase n=1 Tax=Hasllibacter sp. MH4015 TaxID=2854029 RepID=UPI001CD1DCFA|nr:sulfatase-like hydrolase/transferase [Hasllibacter sp. MH4015]
MAAAERGARMMGQMNGRGIARLIAATLILHLVLVQPNHPDALSWGALLLFPLELPVLIFALLALGAGRAGRVFRWGVTVALSVIVVLKAADFVSFTALSRGFNPVSDLALVDAFVRLLVGAIGPFLAVLVCVAALVGIVLLAIAIWWATGVWARVSVPRAVTRVSGGLAVVAAVIAAAEIGQAMRVWALPVTPPGAAFTARVGVERVIMVRDTLRELRAFRSAMADDPYRGRADLLDRIDRDVVVIFVESYGRASLDTPLYADLHRGTLARYQALLEEAGLTLRSGILSAPTRGGQSWLSHATFANGLWINDQIRYGAALSSGREGLFHHAAQNGFQTAVVMPQITLDWPEVERMGFQTVLVAEDLGYEGLPFNWVTMPDQFTLAALDRLVRDGAEDPLFVQVALASSHAPWVPVPQVLPWDAIGDGQIYNEVAMSGDPPEVVWRDRDRVRAQYRLAVDYSLRSVMEYALLHADDPPLLLVIGDHQAAEFVALDDRPDVPIHVIGPARLVDPLAEIAPTGGLLPGDDVPVIPMDRLRDILLNVYTTQPIQGVAE